MGYLRQGVKGISWVGLFRGFTRLLAVIRTAILARLLTPAQFGDYGIAALILAFLELITETGINVVLIQNNEKDIKKYLNTAWVTSIIRGSIIGALILISTPLVANFFNAPNAVPLIGLMSVVALIRGFINPAIVLFQKELQFNKEFTYRVITNTIDTIVAISWALAFRSPTGLIIGMIAGVFTEVVLSHLLIKPTPRFVFQTKIFVQIVSQGKWITAAGILSYFTNKGTDIAIGRLLSSTSLGLYQMGYKFSLLFVEEIHEIFNRVAFPLYVKIAGDKNRTLKAFLKTYGTIQLLVAPLMLGVYLLAEPFTLLVLGEQWLTVIPILQALSLTGMVVSLAAPTNPLFLAYKKQDFVTISILANVIVLVILILPLTTSGGLVGAIWAYLISMSITVPIRAWFTWKIFR
jgi:O-antigen/teichoic acid export membrane protein